MGAELPPSRLREPPVGADPGNVAHARTQPQAGRFAEARYRALVRSEMRPRALRAALQATLSVGGIVAFFWIFQPHRAVHMSLLLGGMLLGCLVALAAFRPWWIEKWRAGAEAERATERLLAPLTAEGWHAVHDIDTGRGNLDHVVVGPGGVYLLETKARHGRTRFEGDRLVVRRADDPVEESWDDQAAHRTRARAAALRQALGRANVRWVNAVIVLHGDFEAGVAEGENITALHADRLADWLRAQPTRLPPYRVKEIAAALAELGPEDFG